MSELTELRGQLAAAERRATAAETRYKAEADAWAKALHQVRADRDAAAWAGDGARAKLAAVEVVLREAREALDLAESVEGQLIAERGIAIQRAEAAEARAVEAEQRASRLAEAARPWAEIADWWDKYRPGASDDARVSAWGCNMAEKKELRLGAVRSLRAALAEQPGPTRLTRLEAEHEVARRLAALERHTPEQGTTLDEQLDAVDALYGAHDEWFAAVEAVDAEQWQGTEAGDAD